MPSIDEILASSPLAGLRRVSASGGDREVALVRLAESFTDLDRAPAESLVILSRFASAEIGDYRLDMALRWGAIHRVAAVAAFSGERWQPTVTARDIAARADIALLSIPAGLELAALVQAIMREIGGGAERALGRAQQGLEAVLAAESAGGGLEDLRAAVSTALGTPVEFRPWAGDGFSGAGDAAARSASNGGSGSGGHGARPGDRTAGRGLRTGRGRRGAGPGTLSRRMRTATSGWPCGSCCTRRRWPPGGSSTWPGGRTRRRSGRAANCWPSC